MEHNAPLSNEVLESCQFCKMLQ